MEYFDFFFLSGYSGFLVFGRLTWSLIGFILMILGRLVLKVIFFLGTIDGDIVDDESGWVVDGGGVLLFLKSLISWEAAIIILGAFN